MDCRDSPTCGRSPDAKEFRMLPKFDCKSSPMAETVQLQKQPACDSSPAAKPFQGPSLFQTNRPPQNLHARHRGAESTAGGSGKRNCAAACAARFLGPSGGRRRKSRGKKQRRKAPGRKMAHCRADGAAEAADQSAVPTGKTAYQKSPAVWSGSRAAEKQNGQSAKRQASGRPRPQRGPAQKRRRLCQNAV